MESYIGGENIPLFWEGERYVAGAVMKVFGS